MVVDFVRFNKQPREVEDVTLERRRELVQHVVLVEDAPAVALLEEVAHHVLHFEAQLFRPRRCDNRKSEKKKRMTDCWERAASTEEMNGAQDSTQGSLIE